MALVSWILFGALAGWLASSILGVEEKQGCLKNVVIGILGAFLGGFLHEIVTGRGIDFHWNLRSFAVAVLGAVILLALTGKRKRSGS